MMKTIHALNVCHALGMGIDYLIRDGVEEPSRNGPVIVSPVPVTTVYQNPMERVLFSAARDANPFFHLAEAFWMLRGKEDAAALNHFIHDFGARYAEHGVLYGAYGWRWRNHFEDDQLDLVVARLKNDWHDRRSVIAMWDPSFDLFHPDVDAPKDIPCNTHIYLRINNGSLDLTVCCRSNDAIWGAHGANAVHFSILQEYLAARIGCQVGVLYQVSNNYHVYVSELRKIEKRCDQGLILVDDRYSAFRPTKLVDDPTSFDRELATGEYHMNRFLRDTFKPMMDGFDAWKRKEDPYCYLDQVHAQDWRTAATEWMNRRLHKDD